MLTSARDHYRRQQRISAAGLIAARRVARKGPLAVAQALVVYQLAAARDAVDAVPAMLAEQHITAAAAGAVSITAFAGVASDGRPLDTLFAQAETEQQRDLMVVTQMQDVARLAAGVAMVARPKVTGYVRMLNPPSCSRCAVLAGKFYKWNAGFARHPRCDCRHIPSTEDASHDLTTNPDDYFGSLSRVEQDKIFTKAGGQAIRDGGDINQVVNARRGAQGLTPAGGRLTLAEQKMLRGGNEFRGALERVDVYVHQVYITREGITTRGLANKAGRSSKAPRLMPESLYEIAADRADAIRLLRVHGYLI